jgi:hypothetical protein
MRKTIITAASSQPPTLHSINCAGYIVTAAAGGHVGIVTAYWTVPQARPGRSVGKPPYQAATWVGVNGGRPCPLAGPGRGAAAAVPGGQGASCWLLP